MVECIIINQIDGGFMSRYKKRKNMYEKSAVSFKRWVAGMWLIAVIVFVPLVFHNYYYDILPFKYHFLIGAHCLTFFLFTAYTFLSDNNKKHEFDDLPSLVSYIIKSIKNLNFTSVVNFVKPANFAEKAMLVFIAVYTISTLTSDRYVLQSFMGNEGRYNGLLLMSMYVIMYFMLKKHIKFSRHIITAFLSAGLFICIFGITDYFNMDILSFKVDIEPIDRNNFTSTIGNINTYTTYVGQFIAVSGTLFMLSPADFEKTEGKASIGRLLFYYICMAVGFMALAMGKSDNGYLTLAAFFGILPFVAWRNRRGFRRYIITLTTYFSVIKIIGVLNKSYADTVIGIDGIYQYIAEFKYMNFVVLFLCAAALVICAIDYKTAAYDKKLPVILRQIWLAFLVIVTGCVIYLFYKANTDPDAVNKFGSVKNYLIFNDNWGTNRGYIWRVAIEEYLKLPPVQKIFGTGPETFGIYMKALRYEDMVVRTRQYFDNAHNEYIQFLFTIGPFGVLSYIIMTLGTAYLCIKAWAKGLVKEEQGVHLVAAAFLIICYAAQATVNLYVPITSCIVWGFMTMSAGMLKDVKFKTAQSSDTKDVKSSQIYETKSDKDVKAQSQVNGKKSDDQTAGFESGEIKSEKGSESSETGSDKNSESGESNPEKGSESGKVKPGKKSGNTKARHRKKA